MGDRKTYYVGKDYCDINKKRQRGWGDILCIIC